MAYRPSSIREKLSKGIWLVRFTKVDGTLRDLRCTRDFEYIEAHDASFTPGTGKRIIPNHQIIVWDLDNNGYRSFRIKSIINIKQLEDSFDSNKFVDRNTISNIKSKLSNGTWSIIFNLISGDPYEMICTRDFEKLGSDIIKSESGSRYIPENQVIVWDTNVQGFRSFRYDNIISMKKISDEVKIMVNKFLRKSKQDIESDLDQGIWKLKFTKRDGSTRTMLCTKDKTLVKEKYSGVIYPHLILVYDLENHGFRNIVYSSIFEMTKVSHTLKNFSENQDSEQLIRSTISRWIPIFNKKYNIRIPEIEIRCDIKTPGESPANCSTSDWKLYTLNFDIDKIDNNFTGQAGYIAFHELVHIVNDLVIDSKSNISDGDKLLIKRECGGHGPSFIDIMLTSGYKFNNKEFDLLYNRHILGYINDQIYDTKIGGILND